MIKYAIGSIVMGVLFLIVSAAGFNFGLNKAALGYDPLVILALLIMVLMGIALIIYGFLIVNQVVVNCFEDPNLAEMIELRNRFPHATDELLEQILKARQA